MYIADNDTEFLPGKAASTSSGRIHPPGRVNTHLASLAAKSRPLTGRFVPLFPQDEEGPIDVNELPARLGGSAQGAGCLNFVRLEDVTPVKSQPNSFYFVDTGAEDFYDPITGRPVTASGPHSTSRGSIRSIPPASRSCASLRRRDGVRTTSTVPTTSSADDRYVWIQEDPGERGIHTARILRYDTETRRIEPMAECAEWDAKGNYLPKGIGGGGSRRGSWTRAISSGPTPGSSRSRLTISCSRSFTGAGRGPASSPARPGCHEGEGRRDEGQARKGVTEKRSETLASRRSVPPRHGSGLTSPDVSVASPYRRSTMFRSRSSCRQRSIARRQSRARMDPSCNRESSRRC